MISPTLERVQNSSQYSAEVTDGILRFLLHLTDGNLLDEVPYPATITPLNHIKFCKYKSTLFDLEGQSGNERVLDIFRRHQKGVDTLLNHPKSVFKACSNYRELVDRSRMSHNGDADSTFFNIKNLSVDSGIGESEIMLPVSTTNLVGEIEMDLIF